MTHDGKTTSQIAEIVARHAGGREHATSTIGAVVECIVGAASPILHSGLFTGGTTQERLLFTLIMAGACAHLDDHSNADFHLSVSVTPASLREAFDIFTRLTDKDIQHHLPKAMVEYAARQAPLH